MNDESVIQMMIRRIKDLEGREVATAQVIGDIEGHNQRIAALEGDTARLQSRSFAANRRLDLLESRGSAPNGAAKEVGSPTSPASSPAPSEERCAFDTGEGTVCGKPKTHSYHLSGLSSQRRYWHIFTPAPSPPATGTCTVCRHSTQFHYERGGCFVGGCKCQREGIAPPPAAPKESCPVCEEHGAACAHDMDPAAPKGKQEDLVRKSDDELAAEFNAVNPPFVPKQRHSSFCILKDGHEGRCHTKNTQKPPSPAREAALDADLALYWKHRWEQLAEQAASDAAEVKRLNEVIVGERLLGLKDKGEVKRLRETVARVRAIVESWRASETPAGRSNTERLILAEQVIRAIDFALRGPVAEKP